MNNNFKWLSNDIDNTLVLKVVSNEDNNVSYGAYCVMDVLEVDGDKINVATANIDDLTSLLTLGMVRFVNISNSNDILDIPLRNIYLLYKNAKVLGKDKEGRLLSIKELDAFSVISGKMRDDLLVFSGVIGDVTNDLKDVMEIAYLFGSYGMQEKFDALNRITIINHQRLVNDKKERESR